MTTSTDHRKHASKLLRRLRRDYADADCALEFDTPVQLLVATILSAQCTDERVNKVTRVLFQRYPTAADLAALPVSKLERLIQSTGFFRNKARNIKSCCQQLVDEHGGKVPQDMDALVALPGVGRKTANVVLGTAYGLATGVVVDTHVGRLSRRMGLTQQTDPVKVELELMKLIPKKEWVQFSHRMIHHGRAVCRARRPLCEECGTADVCPRIGVA